ncbi:PTBP3 protein, partial [Alcedo cyanopectus]|nr:PTBP3 protein [Ceyx cyanopectus]
DEKNKPKKGRASICPSRVLHLRHIPGETTEEELVSLGLPFGKVSNVLVLKGKHQAFLEMSSEESAASLMKYYNTSLPSLHEQTVHIQFSYYKELIIDSYASQTKAQGALQAVSNIQPQNLPIGFAFPDEGVQGGLLPGQGSVIRIIVKNTAYRVTLEMIHQIFARFGSVLKIVMFTRASQTQALLQFAHPMQAYHAKMTIDGQTIIGTCCTLIIQFSRLNDLRVKYNNEKSRDFTRPDLPSGDGQPSPQVPDPFVTPNVVYQPFGGVAGYVPPMGFGQGTVSFCFSNSVVLARGTGDLSEHTRTCPCAICSNILFKLLFWFFTGVYGNVHRVKIMFKKRDNALIQMANTTQAHLAISYLNGQKVYGRVIHVSLSKHQVVKFPFEGQRRRLTRDFSKSPLNRFRMPGSKNFLNIYPPNDTLHLSNIPSSVTVEDLKDLFSNTGSNVVACKFFKRDCRMALIQLGSVEEAIHALIELHNYNIGEKHHLHISFSKSAI